MKSAVVGIMICGYKERGSRANQRRAVMSLSACFFNNINNFSMEYAVVTSSGIRST